jgi:hypothetical protein
MTPLDLSSINPGGGLGDLPFGASRENIRHILGEPTELITSEDSETEIWIYEELAVALSFAADVDFRFVSCETFSVSATLGGERLIGVNRAEAEAALKRVGVLELEWHEDEEVSELWAADAALHVWFEDGKVESIGWSVLFDEDLELAAGEDDEDDAEEDGSNTTA